MSRTYRKQGRSTAPCSHAGCKKTIREGTWNFPTGFCLDHQPKPKPKPERPNVRIAMAHLVPGCSTLSASHPVSLSREPWL